MSTQYQSERIAHLRLLGGSATAEFSYDEEALNEIRTAPLFSRRVRLAVEGGRGIACAIPDNKLFPQYGLLGLRKATFGPDKSQDCLFGEIQDEDMIYANLNAPWSAFICGSQGGGKSHTLSCLLENSLLRSSPGLLPKPLTGIIFHYDKFTSSTSTQFCEAAYLSSKGIPVTVLVAPSNVHDMQMLYDDLPGFPPNAIKPRVLPLRLQERQLNVANIMTLMGANDATHVPLYMGVLKQILREMAAKKQGGRGVDYEDFENRLAEQNFTKDQSGPLSMRLQLLNEFLERSKTANKAKANSARRNDIWCFKEGSLTIVDLSCPFVNEKDACALFTICLGLFLEDRSMGGRVIALDEAHKFLTQCGEAEELTGQLETIIRQQRHLGTRVLIATQEPTLKPSLLDLCDVSIIHRFRSPAWFDLLKNHLAGARRGESNKPDASDAIFRTIVGLRTGEALVFSPTAMLDMKDMNTSGLAPNLMVNELRDAYVKVRIRQRTTADGGKSLMAVGVGVPVVHVAIPESAPTLLDLSKKYGFSNTNWGTSFLTNRAVTVQGSAAQNVPTLGRAPLTYAGAEVKAVPARVPDPVPQDLSSRPRTIHAKPRAASPSALPVIQSSLDSLTSGLVRLQANAKSIPEPASPGNESPTDSTSISSNSADDPSERPPIPDKAPFSPHVDASLRRNVVQLLHENATTIDFAAVRRATEKEYGLKAGYFVKKDTSGNIIKEAVEEFLRSTNLPPPKNATWLF